MMRKRLIPHPRDVSAASQPWLDVAELAQVELTSEDPACPIDAALRPSPTPGWRAAEPGAQRIRLVFDHPQALHRLRNRTGPVTAEREQRGHERAWHGGDRTSPPHR